LSPPGQNVFPGSLKASITLYFAWGCFRYFS
jgi:hypothetical protein